MALEKEYQPSKWSPRGDSNQVIQSHIASMTAGNVSIHAVTVIYNLPQSQNYKYIEPSDIRMVVDVFGVRFIK